MLSVDTVNSNIVSKWVEVFNERRNLMILLSEAIFGALLILIWSSRLQNPMVHYLLHKILERTLSSAS
jgi:hypothetical protein